MIEFALRTLLLTDQRVASLVGTRVYPLILPQAPTYPAITYQIITGESHYSMQGPSNLASPRVQVDCYAESYDDAVVLKAAVMKALGGFRGVVESAPPVKIHGAFKAMERDEHESGLERAGPRVWRKSLDFNIWFKETF